MTFLIFCQMSIAWNGDAQLAFCLSDSISLNNYKKKNISKRIHQFGEIEQDNLFFFEKRQFT